MGIGSPRRERSADSGSDGVVGIGLTTVLVRVMDEGTGEDGAETNDVGEDMVYGNRK